MFWLSVGKQLKNENFIFYMKKYKFISLPLHNFSNFLTFWVYEMYIFDV
jgi:hypothetical protein